MMGLGVFAPCVLLPEWRDYQALDAVRQVERHRLDSLKDRVEHERRVLDALRGDPSVVARFAQRDLRLRRAGERVVLIDVPAIPAQENEPFVPVPAEPPRALSRLATFLPDYDYDRIFCADESRPVLIAMSLALIALAAVLFDRRSTSP